MVRGASVSPSFRAGPCPPQGDPGGLSCASRDVTASVRFSGIYVPYALPPASHWPRGLCPPHLSPRGLLLSWEGWNSLPPRESIAEKDLAFHWSPFLHVRANPHSADEHADVPQFPNSCLWGTPDQGKAPAPPLLLASAGRPPGGEGGHQASVLLPLHPGPGLRWDVCLPLPRVPVGLASLLGCGCGSRLCRREAGGLRPLRPVPHRPPLLGHVPGASPLEPPRRMVGAPICQGEAGRGRFRASTGAGPAESLPQIVGSWQFCSGIISKLVLPTPPNTSVVMDSLSLSFPRNFPLPDAPGSLISGIWPRLGPWEPCAQVTRWGAHNQRRQQPPPTPRVDQRPAGTLGPPGPVAWTHTWLPLWTDDQGNKDGLHQLQPEAWLLTGTSPVRPRGVAVCPRCHFPTWRPQASSGRSNVN